MERLMFLRSAFFHTMNLSRPLTDRDEVVCEMFDVGSSLKTYFWKFAILLKLGGGKPVI